MKVFDQFLGNRSAVDLTQPLGIQLADVIAKMGLTDEFAAARQMTPRVAELCEDALLDRMAAHKVAGAAGESARSRLDRQRRERFEASGQRALPLDELRGSKDADLRAHLTFAEWLVGGVLMSVDDILADAMRRSEVRADLARAEADLKDQHDMVLKDLMIWNELCARRDCVAMAAE